MNPEAHELKMKHWHNEPYEKTSLTAATARLWKIARLQRCQVNYLMSAEKIKHPKHPLPTLHLYCTVHCPTCIKRGYRKMYNIITYY